MNRLHYRLHVGKREFEKWCLLVNSTTMRSISSSSSLLQKKKQEEEGRRGETIPIHRLPTPPMEEEEIRTTLSAPTFLASSFNSNNASAATPLLAPLPLKRSVSLDSEETIMPAPKRRDSPSRPYTPPSEIKL